MPSSFNMENMPFNLLDEGEANFLRQSLDIGYYQKGEVLLAAGDEPEGVFIIFK